jgi:hypothetical protein
VSDELRFVDKLLRGLVRLAGRVERGELDEATCRRIGRAIGVALDGHEPKLERKANPKATADAVRRVFDAWREATGRTGRTVLTQSRAAKIRARLAEGFSERELVVAIEQAAASDWHAGNNDRGQRYDDIPTILRSADTVERWRDAAELAGADLTLDTTPAAPVSLERKRLEAAAAAALTEGRTDEYERINGELAELG